MSAAAPSPGAAAVMLDRLDVRCGHRVLEVGTGTGYITALLAARVGADHVTSIDVNPERLAQAGDHLSAIGHRPRLAIADPLDGLPAGAPYDRIIVTGAVSTVPGAWIEQLTAGGRIVVPWGVGHAFAVLVRTSQSELTGRVDSRPVDLLPLRAMDRLSQPVPVGIGSPRTAPSGDVQWGTTWVSPSVFADPDARLWLSLHLPGARILDARPSPHGVPIATGGRCWQVAQDGRRIWTIVEAAVRAYERAGRPRRHRLGVTIRSEPPEQSLWLESPHSTHRWPLPGSRSE